MFRKALITLIVMLIPGFLFSQKLSRDERLRIAFNNAMVLTGMTEPDDYRAVPGWNKSAAKLLIYQIGGGYMYMLRQFPVSSLIGHRVGIGEYPYKNIMGKDSLTVGNSVTCIESYDFKQLENKKYELTITIRGVFTYGEGYDVVSCRIYIDEDEPDTFSYIWYDSERKIIIKLMKTADGKIRPHEFYEGGNLKRRHSPVDIDQYGRITMLPYGKTVVKYTYSSTHHLERYDIEEYEREGSIVEKNGEIILGGKIHLKRGQIEDIPYFDEYYYDSRSITGITKKNRYYLFFDRDDCSVNSSVYILKRVYEQEQEELRRKQNENRLKEEQDEARISVRLVREQKMRASYQRAVDELKTLDSLHKKYFNDYYREKYPNIYRACWRLSEKMGVVSFPPTHYSSNSVLEWYGKRTRNHMEIIEIIKQYLDNPINKKGTKELERSLKKAYYEEPQIKILTAWLKNRGCNILMPGDHEKSNLIVYKSCMEELKGLHGKPMHDKIIDAGYDYVRHLNWTGIPYLSEELLSRCIEMQKFIIRLINDDTLKEEKKKLLQALRAIPSRYDDRVTNGLLTKHDAMVFIALEECMRNNGITVLDAKEIDKIHF